MPAVLRSWWERVTERVALRVSTWLADILSPVPIIDEGPPPLPASDHPPRD